jgi:hypothetical protein
MGGAHSRHRKGKKCTQYFGWKTRRKERNSENLDVDGRIKLQQIGWGIVGVLDAYGSG